MIVIYSKIYQNENYGRFFSSKINKPTSKYENLFYNILQKIEILQEQNELVDIPPLQLIRGVYEYLMYAQCDIPPDQPSTFFNLLINLIHIE